MRCFACLYGVLWRACSAGLIETSTLPPGYTCTDWTWFATALKVMGGFSSSGQS